MGAIGNAAGQDLCATATVRDALPRAVPQRDKPAYLQPYVDPAFGSTVTRITDAGFGGVIKPAYNTIQAWNADESRLLLYQTGTQAAGHYLYDTQDYGLIKRLEISPPDLEQVFWDHSNPNWLYYVNTRRNGSNDPAYLALIRFDISTDQAQALHSFADLCASTPTGGNDIQMMSADSDVLGLRCSNANGERITFGYRLSTDTVGAAKTLADDEYNAAQSAPSGQRFYLQGEVVDSDMTVLRSLDLGSASEHGSLGRFANGDDGYFAVAFGASPGGCGGDPNGGTGTLIAHNLTNGNCRVLMSQSAYGYPLSGIHPSAVGLDGWVAVSAIGYGQFDWFTNQLPAPVLFSEIFLSSTDDTNTVCRLAHHRSFGKSATQGGYVPYFGEPHPVISPSGRQIIFGSDWYDSGSVDTYLISLGLPENVLFSDGFE